MQIKNTLICFLRTYKLAIFIALLLFILPFFGFDNSHVILGGEIYAPANINTFFDRGSFLWANVGIGMPHLYFIGVVYHILWIIFSKMLIIGLIDKTIVGLFYCVSFITCFCLLKTVIKNCKIYSAILGSLFYVFNPFLAMMLPWIPTYGFLFMFGPLILKLFIDYLNDNSKKLLRLSILFITILLFTPVALNLALFCVIFIVLFLYSTFYIVFHHKKVKSIIIKLFLFAVTVLLANVFWLIPLASFYKSVYSEAVVYETNFQKESIFGQPVLKAFTLNEYYWFDKTLPNGKLAYEYSRYYQEASIVAILVLLCFLLYRQFFHKDYKTDRFKFFIFALLIIGIFLTKGTSSPFGWLYKECISSIQYCGIFRSSDVKFPYLAVLAASLLIGSVISKTEEQNKPKKYLNYIIVCSVVAMLGAPFFLNQIISKESIVQIPQYWNEINNHYDENIVGRTLLMPKNYSPFDSYEWGYEGGWLPQQLSKNSFIGYTLGYGSSVQEKRFSISNPIYDLIEKGEYEKSLKMMRIFNIKYILDRKDFDLESNSKTAANYGSSNPIYKNIKINKIFEDKISTDSSWGNLEKMEIDDSYFLSKIYIPNNIIIENKNKSLEYLITNSEQLLRPAVYYIEQNINIEKISEIKQTINSIGDNTHINYEYINPAKYKVSITNVTSPFLFVFSENFHELWKIYPTADKTKHKIYNITKNIFQKQIITDNNLFMVNGYANSWTVSPKEICSQSPQSCTLNRDGSFNIEFNIEFYPQKLFYLGIAITTVFLFLSNLVIINNAIRYIKVTVFHKLSKYEKRAQN